jgi:hypothetical protein
MKTTAVLLILGVIIAGCAGMESSKSGARKYLQMRNPINSELLSQIEFPKEASCLFMLSSIKESKDPQQRKAAEFVSCNSASASSSLPYSTRVRDRATNTVFNVEYSNIELCEMAQQVHENQNNEIVIPCSRK